MVPGHTSTCDPLRLRFPPDKEVEEPWAFQILHSTLDGDSVDVHSLSLPWRKNLSEEAFIGATSEKTVLEV